MGNKLLTKGMDTERLTRLALPDQSPRHSFRRSLPPKIAGLARQERDLEKLSDKKEEGFGEDVSLFLLSFLAFFTAFYMFIV